MEYNDLSIRMKKYEDVTRYHLLPRSYVFVRVDGRSFHSYLKECKKPFDDGVIEDMDKTAIYLCENIQNAKLGFVQSDEITILLCDFTDYNTSQFFDGNIQKMSSVTAAMATARFNQLRFSRITREYKSPLWDMDIPLATFDCRYWVVPSRWEAANVFIWRNQDCSRNSVSMVAQSLYSHKELQGKSAAEQQEMIHDKGKSWVNDFTAGQKNGRLIVKEEYVADITYNEVLIDSIPVEGQTVNGTLCGTGTTRTRWVSKGAWKFTEDKEKLLAMIPQYE